MKFRTNNKNHEKIEKERYDLKATLELQELSTNFAEKKRGFLNSHSIRSALLNEPYDEYYQLIRKNLKPKMKVLEIGAGTGTHTSVLIETGASVTVLDISSISLEVLKFKLGNQIKTICADMNKMPLPNKTFDIIVCAGSLSYVDLDSVLSEIMRLLKYNGSIIFVDSLNHNLIYRINRFRRFLLRQRSYSTIQRMPTLERIQKIQSCFETSQVKFFGAYLWLLIPMSKFLSQSMILNIDSFFKRFCPSDKNSFKFVLYCNKIKF